MCFRSKCNYIDESKEQFKQRTSISMKQLRDYYHVNGINEMPYKKCK